MGIPDNAFADNNVFDQPFGEQLAEGQYADGNAAAEDLLELAALGQDADTAADPISPETARQAKKVIDSFRILKKCGSNETTVQPGQRYTAYIEGMRVSYRNTTPYMTKVSTEFAVKRSSSFMDCVTNKINQKEGFSFRAMTLDNNVLAEVTRHKINGPLSSTGTVDFKELSRADRHKIEYELFLTAADGFVDNKEDKETKIKAASVRSNDKGLALLAHTSILHDLVMKGLDHSVNPVDFNSITEEQQRGG